MIVVTGTKRSGTSMWMQVLRAGGIETIGSAFNKVWAETIKDANKRGFYESRFRRGIYYATNPHPETGVWLSPQRTRHTGVKVFIPGVVRSDVCYLSRVVASVRPFRQYAMSLDRLYTMEREALAKRNPERPPPCHLDPILEWWLENFLLVRDIATRRYPIRLVSYESMLEDPERICSLIFEFLETGDASAAMAAVHPEDRTQGTETRATITHRHEEVFDEYHARVKQGLAFDENFLLKMNETHQDLLPEIEAALEDLAKARLARRKQDPTKARKGEDPLNLDRLDFLLHPTRAGEEE